MRPGRIKLPEVLNNPKIRPAPASFLRSLGIVAPWILSKDEAVHYPFILNQTRSNVRPRKAVRIEASGAHRQSGGLSMTASFQIGEADRKEESMKPELHVFLKDRCIINSPPGPPRSRVEKKRAFPLAGLFLPKLIELGIGGIATLLKMDGEPETVQASGFEVADFKPIWQRQLKSRLQKGRSRSRARQGETSSECRGQPEKGSRSS